MLAQMKRLNYIVLVTTSTTYVDDGGIVKGSMRRST